MVEKSKEKKLFCKQLINLKINVKSLFLVPNLKSLVTSNDVTWIFIAKC